MRDWQEIVAAVYGREWLHPQRRYEAKVAALARPNMVLVDAGCGRDMPLRAILDPAVRYVGIDREGGLCADLERLPLADRCADLVTSKSVFEHLRRPRAVLAEIARILKQHGKLVILTPNFWDPVSIVSWLVPNAWHARLVCWGEGRAERDTFPTFYRANTERRLRRLCADCGLDIETLEFWGQYPSVLQRWPRLFALGCRLACWLDRIEVLRKLRGWIFVLAGRAQPTREGV